MEYAYYRAKAEQCRRLAGSITLEEDPTRRALLAMAEEFEAKAASCNSQGAGDQPEARIEPARGASLLDD
jgi:hypothetical protein